MQAVIIDFQSCDPRKMASNAETVILTMIFVLLESYPEIQYDGNFNRDSNIFGYFFCQAVPAKCRRIQSREYQ